MARFTEDVLTTRGNRGTAEGGSPTRNHRRTDGLPGRGQRLTYPMIRQGGRLERASWDEALDAAAAGLRRIKDNYGPDGFGLFSSSKATNELNFLAGKFVRQIMGSNNIDSCNRT